MLAKAQVEAGFSGCAIMTFALGRILETAFGVACTMTFTE
jgi:hypothetical protein